MKIDEMTLEQARAALHRTRKVAKRVAEEQGWCDEGLEEALEEIGVEPPGRGEQTTFTFTIDVEHEPGETPPAADVEAWLNDMIDNEGDAYQRDGDCEFRRIDDSVSVAKPKLAELMNPKKD